MSDLIDELRQIRSAVTAEAALEIERLRKALHTSEYIVGQHEQTISGLNDEIERLNSVVQVREEALRQFTDELSTREINL